MSAIEIAGDLLKDALKPYFKGRNASTRLENATNDALNSIVHLITTREDVKKNRLGATVMTREASEFKQRGSTPRML